MFKKALVALTALIGISAVVYMYTNSNMLTTLNAQSAPVFQLPKGSKVVLGKYNNKEIVWDIGNNNNNGNYVLMSSIPLVKMASYDSSVPITKTPQSGNSMNDYCLKFDDGNWFLPYCPTTTLENEISTIGLSNNENLILTRIPFLPTVTEVYNSGTLGLSTNDRAFKNSSSYWLKGGVILPEYSQGYYGNYYYHPVQLSLDQSVTVGRPKDVDSGIFISIDNKIAQGYATTWNYNGGTVNKLDLRPFSSVDKSKIMFAVNISYTDGNWHNYVIDTANLNENNELNANKLRIQSSLTAALQDIKNADKTKSIQKVLKSSSIHVSVTANTGSATRMSVILYDNTGTQIQYYKLGSSTQSGANDYTVDLTGIPVGKYQVAVINEEYDASSQLAVESSPISDLLPLEIVEPHKLAYTKQPQSGASSGNDYEFSKNVNAGQTVGKITVNPQGVLPLSYTVETNGDNTYQNFEVDGLSGGTSSSTSLNVKIKSGAPDLVNGGLKAGIYKFCVNSKDANGDPTTATSDSKVCTSFTVAKTNLTAAFDDPNQTKKSITQATAGWSETATVNPSAGTKVTYAKSGGSIGLINIDSNTGAISYTGVLGTPDNATSGTTTYKYGIKNIDDYNYFSVNPSNGEIKTTADLSTTTGSYNITVTVSDNWSTKEIPVTINVGMAAAEDLRFYETSAEVNMITTKSVKITDTNVTVYATVKGSTNNNPVTYRIKDGSTNVIEVNPNSGAITIHGVGTVIIVAEKAGEAGQADSSAELTFTVTAGAQNFIYTDNAGNELPKSGSIYNAYSEVYAPSKTFQLYTAGNPTGTTVTYQLKAGSPTDVISVDANGLVTILNASLNNQMGKAIVQAISHDPSGNYSDKTIELPINIEKGTRVISFAENPIYVTNGKGKVTPVTEVDGVTDTDGDVLIEVDNNEDHTIAWTNDNKNIDYNYSGDTGKDIKIHATKPTNRNYKASEADGTIHIMGPDENILAITSPGQIIYGDHFTIRSSQYDSDSVNVKYTFEIDDNTYVSNPTVSGNSAEFDALKFSGTNKTTITVTRTADGESPLSKKVQVTVLPKPIEIIIDDKEKLKGEQNPTLTYQDFRNKLVSWNGVQDVIQENDIKLSTTARTDSNAGSYPIKGDANSLNKTYPNYSFTFKEGTLTIKEENVEDDWYHLEIDDGNNTAYTGNWTNKDVNIISDHNEYIHMSLDQSTWKPNQVTVSKEGETNQSFWMKKDSGATTKEKQEIIRIDKTAPKVKGIKAKDTNNKLQDIINKISGGIFFKPGTAFEITTSDSKDDLKVSGTKEIAYKVYKITDTGDDEIKAGILSVTNEKASITISETVGKYKVCVIPTDNAGNTNQESCHEVTLKKIDVDVDGDGKPDFNDPDGDGCPDLNIKWKDPNNENKWIVINGDRNNDGIPDLNIDSDGDGKADLNIDTDNDGKPDLNLVILKKSDWKPTKCVKTDIDNGILEEYCTGTGVKAVINIDTDDDGIPNLNIDINGDMKADYNIDNNDDGIANVNIGPKLTVWIPKKDYKAGNFQYDSIGKDDVKPELNIDTDGDGLPDINIDLDGDGIPELNVDTDGDYIPDIDIDSTGDGLPDLNIDTDDDGKADENIVEIKEWKPEKNVDGDLPYDTMSFDEPKEPEKPQKPNKENDPDVKGSYYPGDTEGSTFRYNVGGAITGDTSDFILYIGLCCITLCMLLYIIYRKMNKAIRNY